MMNDSNTAAPSTGRVRLRWVLAVSGYAVILALATRVLDIDRFAVAIARLRAVHILGIVGLVLIHAGLRSLRYYALALRTGPSDFRFADSVRIFLLGLTASAVTPGRAGDLIKVELLHRHQVRRAAALGLVVIERVLDLVTILGTIFVTGFFLSRRSDLGQLTILAAIALVCLIAGVTILTAKRLRVGAIRWVSSVLSRIRSDARRLIEIGERVFDVWDELFTVPGVTVGYLALSCALWIADFLKLWVLLNFMGSPTPLLPILFIYPVSLVAGILTLLPFSEGVVGVTAVALLASVAGADVNAATATVVVDRGLSTLTPLALYGGIGVLGSFRRGVAPTDPPVRSQDS